MYHFHHGNEWETEIWCGQNCLCCISSHHRDVEGPHVGELRHLTGDVAPLAERQRVADAVGVRGVLHILQALRPGGRTHQPQEDQDRRDHEVLGNKERHFSKSPQLFEVRRDLYIYSQRWARSQSPCRRACSLSRPTEPPCSRGSRRWRCPRRTPPRRPSLPSGASSWRSGYRAWCFPPPAAPGLTWPRETWFRSSLLLGFVLFFFVFFYNFCKPCSQTTHVTVLLKSITLTGEFVLT